MGPWSGRDPGHGIDRAKLVERPVHPGRAGEKQTEGRPDPNCGIHADPTADARAKVTIWARPRPVPFAPLVEKKGSKIFASISGGMPVPSSDTDTSTYSPGSTPIGPAVSTSRTLSAVAIVTLPPSGMASRALTARLSRAFSRPLGSQWAGMVTRPSRTLSLTLPFSARPSRSDRPWT